MTDTERITLMHQDARRAAEYYRANFWPVSYSVPHFVNGEWIRVTIEPDSQRMKPIKPIKPEKLAWRPMSESE
jgi:hypothetical protein